MEIREMKMEDIEQRSAEIEELLKSEDADIETLSKEVSELEERKAQILAEVEQRKKEMAEALKSAEEIENIEERKMTNLEVRNTKEYIDAYAEYIKSGDDAECRSLLTENATNGTIPVPEFVYDIVKTAWEKEEIMSLVPKMEIKGNFKVGFEISATDAANHTEGGEAVSEEELLEGVVELTAGSVKKWVSVSDEIYDLRGEAFISYIYRELAHKIAKKTADNLIAAIEECGTVSTTGCVGVPVLTSPTLGQGTIAAAIARLSDEADNPVVVINKLSLETFKNVQYAGNFFADPFEGLKVLYNSNIKAYSAATAGDTYAIVGDFGEGALANYPNGTDITFKFDEMSKKKEDMIEILGRQFVAVKPVAPNAFVKVQK